MNPPRKPAHLPEHPLPTYRLAVVPASEVPREPKPRRQRKYADIIAAVRSVDLHHAVRIEYPSEDLKVRRRWQSSVRHALRDADIIVTIRSDERYMYIQRRLP